VPRTLTRWQREHTHVGLRVTALGRAGCSTAAGAPLQTGFLRAGRQAGGRHAHACACARARGHLERDGVLRLVARDALPQLLRAPQLARLVAQVLRRALQPLRARLAQARLLRRACSLAQATAGLLSRAPLPPASARCTLKS
jgi:hypothetical protein